MDYVMSSRASSMKLTYHRLREHMSARSNRHTIEYKSGGPLVLCHNELLLEARLSERKPKWSYCCLIGFDSRERSD